MTVQWPGEKCAQLASLFDVDWLGPLAGANPQLTPRQIASPLGLVRHGAFVSPMGSFLSLRLQYTLNDAICKQKRHVTKRWWHTSRIRIPDDAMADIHLLRSFLAPESHQQLWTVRLVC